MKQERTKARKEDEKIIAMLFERKEEALNLIRGRYEQYCRGIASDVDWEDFEECFDDTLLQVWNSIPPNKPKNLRRYVAVILRHRVLNMIDSSGSLKRGGGKNVAPLEAAEEFFDMKDFADGMGFYI